MMGALQKRGGHVHQPASHEPKLFGRHAVIRNILNGDLKYINFEPTDEERLNENYQIKTKRTNDDARQNFK